VSVFKRGNWWCSIPLSEGSGQGSYAIPFLCGRQFLIASVRSTSAPESSDRPHLAAMSNIKQRDRGSSARMKAGWTRGRAKTYFQSTRFLSTVGSENEMVSFRKVVGCIHRRDQGHVLSIAKGGSAAWRSPERKEAADTGFCKRPWRVEGLPAAPTERLSVISLASCKLIKKNHIAPCLGIALVEFHSLMASTGCIPAEPMVTKRHHELGMLYQWA
jgi:hypothetical protein